MGVVIGDINRLFLQALLSKQCLSEDLAKVLLRKSVEAVKDLNDSIDVAYSDAFFDATMTKLNRSIEPLGLGIRSVRNEENEKITWALVNDKIDLVSQMATQYSTQEIALFKQIVEQIIFAPNEAYSISSIRALHEVSNLPVKSSMTKSQAEMVLQSFVAREWLAKSARGRYSLSTRSILELQEYLTTTYDDEILSCTSCMEILTKGISCYTPNCKARLHHHCYARYRSQKCPSCNCDWSKQEKLNKVGEEAVKDGDDMGPRHNRRRVTEDSDEEEEAENEKTISDEDDEDEDVKPEVKGKRKR